MKIDLYTKGILTVIALTLVIIVARDFNFVDKAYAHDSPQKQEIIQMIYTYSLNEYDVKTIVSNNCFVSGELIYC